MQDKVEYKVRLRPDGRVEPMIKGDSWYYLIWIKVSECWSIIGITEGETCPHAGSRKSLRFYPANNVCLTKVYLKKGIG